MTSYYRAHLRQLIESEADWRICGEAADGKEAVEKHSAIRPHVTVMDFNMPRMNRLDDSRAILEKCPDAPILLLTMFASSQLTVQAKKHGIKGFCSQVQIDCIAAAIKALRGESYFPESFAAAAGDWSSAYKLKPNTEARTVDTTVRDAMVIQGRFMAEASQGMNKPSRLLILSGEDYKTGAKCSDFRFHQSSQGFSRWREVCATLIHPEWRQAWATCEHGWRD
jgi:DNA-binding NarL/FixJ family response regulator